MGHELQPDDLPDSRVYVTRKLHVTCAIRTRGFFRVCRHSQTYEAYSTVYRTTVWIPLPCKQWSCNLCCEVKIKRLADRCKDAKPNRLLTLTIDPKLWNDPREAFDGTRRKVAELFKRLRTRFGQIEYLRVTELTKGGWPHYHLLVRSGFLPHGLVRDAWKDLTGASIVDLRQVKSHFNTVQYLVKYLSKMHDLKWTNRHVSYSRNFFPPEPPKTDRLGLTDGKVIETHPGELLYHHFRNATIVEFLHNVYHLEPEIGESTRMQVHVYEDYGPPKTKEKPQWQKTPPSPKCKDSQTSFPGLRTE